MELEELERRVRHLEDLEAIRQLKARYAMIVDTTCDADALAAMFTDDGEFILEEGGRQSRDQGRDAIRARFAVMPQRMSFANHNFAAAVIDVDGDTAEAYWPLWAPATLADGLCVFGCGVERDLYRRVDGQWLFARTHYTVFFRAPFGDSWGEVTLAPPASEQMTG